MKGKKIIYLFLALLLPVGVFLFLKFFGKNEFEVKPLYQTEITNIPEDCKGDYHVPYVIPDSLNNRLPEIKNSLLTVVVFADQTDKRSGVHKQVDRVKEEFSKDPVSIVYLDGGGDVDVLRRCVFLLSEEMSVALVDRERRIRGQYNVASLEDADRLIVEMQIILKKY